MSAPRRPRERRLTPDERRLWAEIARQVTPLQGRSLPPEPPSVPEPPPPAPVRATMARAVPAAARPKPALPPLAPIERRVRTALRRGSRTVDAVIDLHGLRQAEAHAALVAFLHRSRGAGHVLVLVVTGKGGPGDDPYAERGVLRRSVPHWLRLPDLRPLVLGFEEAALHHGGSGALYVRLRRRGGA
ncbi:Smr/MutS family protein [Methylobacterium nodulans]|uniref:Smr protein/MutS2 n=1 Tax=Methylobacterium nodulans (strain LMG 21967 / CNCM I-2342 / ORS 2060) TaxID=460265 RepID=B8IHX1_METNO|nr:Smr/MutS family protein [Methylobacterium nodulans]ACL56009.1 Smr protein/MutS2 [Methylobacterium nodulans ORS 2060]